MRTGQRIAIFTCAALLATFVAPPLYWLPSVLGCRVNQDPGTFLAYCNTESFADYEHGAFLWNMEPKATAALRAAEVLFFGDSHTQHAFSSKASKAFFQSVGMSYYLAGFTYGENMTLSKLLIDRFGLRPRAVIINANDTYFTEKPKFITELIETPKTEAKFWKTRYSYILKQTFGRLVRPACNSLGPTLCQQKVPSIWRRFDTGDWEWRETLVVAHPSAFPIKTVGRNQPPDEAALQQMEKAAAILIDRLDLPPRCIILTAIPNDFETNEPIVARVSGRYNLPVIIPQLHGLTTIDHNHLDSRSAEQWSEAFLKLAAPLLAACRAP